MKNNKGQALTEAALTAPLIVIFLFTIIWFGRIMLTWQQLHGAARYGTDLIAYTPLSKNAIKNDIINYLCHRSTIGRILDREELSVDVEIHDLNAPIDFSLSFENIMNFVTLGTFADIYDTFAPTRRKKSFVELSYRYKTPPVLRVFGEYLYIKARSEVLSDSGSPGSQLNDRRRAARK